MELCVEREGEVMYCGVDGRVDSDTVEEFQVLVLKTVEASDRALVLDLSSVPYVSSAGLQSFIIIARQMSRDGIGFGLCGLGAGVRHVFEVSGFDLVLSVFTDRAAAASALLESERVED